MFSFFSGKLSTPEMKQIKYNPKWSNMEQPESYQKAFVSVLVKEIKDGKVYLKDYDEVSVVGVKKIRKKFR